MTFFFCKTQLFFVSNLFALALGELREFVIDDSGSNSIVYSPLELWEVGTSCIGCTSAPDKGLAFQGTWHVSTSDSLTFAQAIINFEGVEISVTSFVASSHLAGIANSLQFFIDSADSPSGEYHASPDSANDFEYLEVFRSKRLAPGKHTLRIQNGFVGGPVGVLFLDKVNYLKDVPRPGRPDPGPPIMGEPADGGEGSSNSDTPTSDDTDLPSGTSSGADDTAESSGTSSVSSTDAPVQNDSPPVQSPRVLLPSTQSSAPAFQGSDRSTPAFGTGSAPRTDSDEFSGPSSTTTTETSAPTDDAAIEPRDNQQRLHPGIIAAIIAIASIILLVLIFILLRIRRQKSSRSDRSRRTESTTILVNRDESRLYFGDNEKGSDRRRDSRDDEGWDFRGGPTPENMRYSLAMLPGTQVQSHNPSDGGPMGGPETRSSSRASRSTTDFEPPPPYLPSGRASPAYDSLHFEYPEAGERRRVGGMAWETDSKHTSSVESSSRFGDARQGGPVSRSWV